MRKRERFMYPFYFSEHLYTLGATGIKFNGGVFATRQAARSSMYKYIDKHHLHIVEKYDDNHFKTYVCDNGVKFYINRM
jgi:hypothetical protein